jgi:hypothetical protein
MRRILTISHGLPILVLAAATTPAIAADDAAHIEQTLVQTRRQAEEYTIAVGTPPRALRLLPEPVLKWSNPEVGEIYGNVFLWTERGRPAVVASLHRWFSPHTHLSHEFTSLSDEAVSAERSGGVVWKTTLPGIKFQPVAEAPPPAESAAARLLQIRSLARQFSARSTDREGVSHELRLLTQPIHRYQPPAEGPSAERWLDGGLFAFVLGTDPELFLLIEAQPVQSDQFQWRFAVARMNSIDLRLLHAGREVWSAAQLPWAEVGNHRGPYTTFRINSAND